MNNIFTVFFLLLFFLGGILIINIGTDEVTSKNDWNNWTSIKGNLKKVHETHSSIHRGTYYATLRADISYSYANNLYSHENVSIKLSGHTAKNDWKENDKFDLKINPDKPNKFMTRGDFGYGNTGIFIVIGVLFTLFPILIGYLIIKKKKV